VNGAEELSNPRAAARSYLTALLAGDAEGALAMVAPCSDDAKKAVAGSARIYGALRRLDGSLGIALASSRTDEADRLALQLQRVDTAWLVVSGDAPRCTSPLASPWSCVGPRPAGGSG